jgi:endonuclease YncB( thermonuclease family)
MVLRCKVLDSFFSLRADHCPGVECPYVRDVNLEMLKAGLAWHYKQYEREQAKEDRERYAAAEEEARAGRVGLWRDAEPVAPWDWRKKEKAERLSRKGK